MWITGDVEILGALTAAQSEGELVIFAGAGVSVGAPSNLPPFRDLARLIGRSCGQSPTARELRNPDVFLGGLGTDVHAEVAEIIGNPDSQPNKLHEGLIRLACANKPRIVTTNYDLHLSAVAASSGLPQHRAPALPLGYDFDGLVYLHGSLDGPPKNLVVTDADFGRAYLTDGWATTFLRDMFNAYIVVFVGYSHDDLVMSYLAKGLSRAARPRYAFTHESESGKWKRFGITPITYPTRWRRHAALTTAIDVWATRASMGLLDHRALIRDIATERPPSDPVNLDYLAECLCSEEKIQFFCEFATGVDWLDWIEGQDAFQLLGSDESFPATRRLALWFADRYVVDEEHSDRALVSIQRLGDRLGTTAWFAVAQRLSTLRNACPQMLSRWVVVLLASAPRNADSVLSYALADCKLPQERDAAILLFDHLLTPKLTLRPSFSISEGASPPRVHAEITFDGDHYCIDTAWKDAFVPNLDHIAEDVLLRVERHLRDAHHLLAAFSAQGSYDVLSFGRSAIEPHDQDKHPNTIDVLIDAGRDALQYHLMTDPHGGAVHIAAWIRSDIPLLRRLAVHGWRERSDKSADEKVKWLLSESLLHDRDTKHEAFRLLSHALPNATAKDLLTFSWVIRVPVAMDRVLLG